ncbi:MAG: hypothetical protein J6M33_10660 [Anaerovibrio sp.]|nr:hypothetical protein [Anaerovibrio sp.]
MVEAHGAKAIVLPVNMDYCADVCRPERKLLNRVFIVSIPLLLFMPDMSIIVKNMECLRRRCCSCAERA